jgi:tetratricopeptide (TPR) repeat protein
MLIVPPRRSGGDSERLCLDRLSVAGPESVQSRGLVLSDKKFNTNMTYKDPLKLAYSKGLHCAASQENEQAVRHFSEAIRIQRDHSDAYYQRALMFYQLARYTEAHNDLLTAIRLAPESPLRADAEEKFRQLEKAA